MENMLLNNQVPATGDQQPCEKISLKENEVADEEEDETTGRLVIDTGDTPPSPRTAPTVDQDKSVIECSTAVLPAQSAAAENSADKSSSDNPDAIELAATKCSADGPTSVSGEHTAKEQIPTELVAKTPTLLNQAVIELPTTSLESDKLTQSRSFNSELPITAKTCTATVKNAIADIIQKLPADTASVNVFDTAVVADTSSKNHSESSAGSPSTVPTSAAENSMLPFEMILRQVNSTAGELPVLIPNAYPNSSAGCSSSTPMESDEDDEDDDDEEEDEEEHEGDESFGGFRDTSSNSMSDVSIGQMTISPDGTVVRKHAGSKSRRKSDRILPLPGDDGSDKFVCPVCRESFLMLHEFTKHIRQHNTVATIPTINTCTICGKILSSQSSLDRHMLVHSGERPFQCRVCHMAFTTNGNMHRHMRIHEKDFPLSSEMTPGGEMFRQRKKKRKDATQVTDSVDIAENKECDMSLRGKMMESPLSRKNRRKKQSEELELLQSPARKRIRDRECEVVMLNPREIPVASINGGAASILTTSANQIILEPVDIDLDAVRKQCPVCKRQLFSTYGLTNHLNTHEKYRRSRLLLRCMKCSLGWTSIQQHESHMKTVHGGRKLDGKDHKENGSTSAAEEKAVIEPKSSKSKEPKNPALSAANNGSLDLTLLDFTSSKFPLISKVLSEKSPRKPNVSAAAAVDKGLVVAPKQCKTCDRSFTSSIALELHMTSHRALDVQTACQHCERAFSTSKQLKDHILAQHERDAIIAGYSGLPDVEENAKISRVVSKDEFLLCMGLKINARLALSKPTVDQNQPMMSASKEEPTKLVLLSPTKVQLDANQNQVKSGSPVVGRSLLRGACPDASPLELRQTTQLVPMMPEGIAFGTQGLAQHPTLQALPFFQNFSVADVQKLLTHLPSVKFVAGTRPGVSGHNLLTGFSSQASVSRADSDAASGSVDSRILPPMPFFAESNSVDSPVEESDDSSVNVSTGQKTPDKDDGPYGCQYCEETFINKSTYKAHVRTHLNLSPFKCMLCSYCSTDKSTLIRHLRTHNGERPFQCLVCEFAFTTKANCERHVRKKHRRDNKDDIENSIGYNRLMAECSVSSAATPVTEATGPAAVTLPPSVETVCKYCGEDFKFFRALKHHVRSQTSCQHKPFLCKMCAIGFSTKANCLRHIQKQHPEIEPSNSESQMQVKVDILDAQTRLRSENGGRGDIRATSMSSEEPKKSDDARRRTAKRKLHSLATSQQSEAPEKKQLLQRQALMLSVMAPVDLMTSHAMRPAHSVLSSFITPVMKQERMQEDDEQPLDFSVKTHCGSLNLSLNGGVGVARERGGSSVDMTNDQPMDLTIKSRDLKLTQRESDLVSLCGAASPPGSIARLPCSPVNLAKRQILVSPPSSSTVANVEQVAVQNENELQRFYVPTTGCFQCPDCPMQFKDGVKLLSHSRSHNNNRSQSCQLCSAAFTSKGELDRHTKSRHSQPSQHGFANNEISGNLIRTEEARHFSAELNNNNPSTIDANVRYIITDTSIPPAAAAAVAVAAAASTNANAANIDLQAEVSKILEAAARTAQPFFQYTPRSGMQQLADVEANLDNTTSPIPMKSNVTIDSINESMARCFKLKAQEESMIKLEQQPRENSLTPGNESGELSQDSLAKKKRNSYADSPHKLRCPYCPRAFPWISSLKRHILTHTGQKPFRCPQCTVTFSTKSNRERHMIRKHGIDVHDPATRQMMDRPFKCHLCVFSSFSSSGKLLRHYRAKHPDKEIPEALASNMASMSQEELSIALNNLGGSAERSGRDRSDNGSDDPDLDDEEDEDDDDSAGEEQAEAERLTMKYLSENSVSRTASPSIVDTSGGRSVATASARATARSTPDFCSTASEKLHHVNPERDNYNVDKITECWKCWKTFDSRKTLLRHLKEHNIDLPFKCYLCDASFTMRLDSLEHKAAKHQTEWASVHDKNKVGTMTEYADLMDKVVEDTLAGNITKRVHEGIDLDIKPESDYAQRKVFCTLCPKRFWSLQDLRRHMRSHTGERPFECDICQARFTLKHSMMRHRRKHTDEHGAVDGDVTDDEEDSVHSNDHEVDAADPPPSTDATVTRNSVRALPDVCLTSISTQSAASCSTTAAPRQPMTSTAVVKSEACSERGANVESAQKPSGAQSDLLQNLLGIDDTTTIDQMLDSPEDAATMLGIRRGTKKTTTI